MTIKISDIYSTDNTDWCFITKEKIIISRKDRHKEYTVYNCCVEDYHKETDNVITTILETFIDREDAIEFQELWNFTDVRLDESVKKKLNDAIKKLI